MQARKSTCALEVEQDEQPALEEKGLSTIEGTEIPAERLQAMKDYALELRRRFPHMKLKRLERKVAEHFKIKLK